MVTVTVTHGNPAEFPLERPQEIPADAKKTVPNLRIFKNDAQKSTFSEAASMRQPVCQFYEIGHEITESRHKFDVIADNPVTIP